MDLLNRTVRVILIAGVMAFVLSSLLAALWSLGIALGVPDATLAVGDGIDVTWGALARTWGASFLWGAAWPHCSPVRPSGAWRHAGGGRSLSCAAGQVSRPSLLRLPPMSSPPASRGPIAYRCRPSCPGLSSNMSSSSPCGTPQANAPLCWVACLW